MRIRFAYFCGLALLLTGSPVMSLAAPQITPYIAIHTSAKYTHLPAMPYANPTARKGGRIIYADNGTFDNLNGMNGKGSWVEGTNYVFDTLMAKSLDEPNVFYPLLAEKVRFDPDKTSDIVYYLNPKARFSDGSPLTASDVKFSFDKYLKESNPGLQMYLSDVDQVQVLGPHTVRMTFKSANNAEMPGILSQMPIFSQKDWLGKDFSKITLRPILGSGPYTIKQIDPGRSITYQRNPNYWGRNLPVNRGRYNFDQIKYVYYRNQDVAFEGFKSGQYTFHEELTSRKWMTEYHFPAVKQGLVKKYEITLRNPAPTQSYIFNTRRAPLNDIYFRQALTYAYDFEWQNKALFYGQYQRLHSHFQYSDLEAKGHPSVEELKILKSYLPKLHPLQQKGALVDWKYPVTDASGFNRHGLLQARSILLKAGYRIQNGQLSDTQGQPIHFELLIHQDGLQRTLMAFIRNARKLGIHIQIRHVDTPQYLERLRRYDFDLTTMVMPQSLTPGNEQAQLWSSRAASEPGNYNFSGIRNTAIDDAVQQVIRAQNRQQLIVRTRVLDRLLRAGYYQILTYSKPQSWYAYWNMYQQPSVQPKLDLGEDYWWVDPAQEKKVAQYLRRQ